MELITTANIKSGVNKKVKYYLTTSNEGYGIFIICSDKEKVEIPNISTRKRLILNIIRKIARNKVTPSTTLDIVYDEIG